MEVRNILTKQALLAAFMLLSTHFLQADPIILSIQVDTTICQGTSVQLFVDAPTAVTYQWSPDFMLSCGDCPDPLTEMLNGDQTFSVTVTDAQGNTESAQVNIYIQNYIDFGLLLFTNSPVCEGGMLEFYPNVLDAQSYTWTGPDGVISHEPEPFISPVTFAEAGNYTLEIVDQIGCEVSASFDVEVFPGFDVLLTPNASNSSTFCNGTLDIEVIGGTPPYLYSLDAGVTWTSSPTIADLCPGLYTLSVSDQHCTQEVLFDILLTDAPPITADVTIQNAYCEGEVPFMEITNVVGGIGPPYEISFDGIIWFDLPEEPIQAFSSYTTLFIRDAVHNMAEFPLVIVEPTPLHVGIQTTNASCVTGTGGTATINVTGGEPPYSFQWQGGTDFIDLAPGTYSITITDANACTVLASFTITTSAIDFLMEDQIICAGESIQLMAQAADAVSVNWSPATGLDNPNSLIPLATPLETTTYTLDVVDAEGCTGQESVTIEVLPDLCIEEWRDTIYQGEMAQWCSIVTQFGSPLPWEITGLLCGEGDEVYFNTDFENLCVTYTGLEIGQDTFCLEICSPISGQCISSYLYITVTDDPVWPGDTDTSALVNHYDVLNLGLAYGQSGPPRVGATIDWEAQPAEDWPQSTIGGTNFKHIDTNGDGQIDVQDTSAISQNWDLMHNFSSPAFENRQGAVPFYVQPDTIVPGSTISLPIILGEENLPVEGVYGLAFSIAYDPEIVVDGSALMAYAPSWLGVPGSDLIVMQRNYNDAGRLDIGITRIDGIEVAGFGEIGQLIISIEEDIFLRHPDFGENGETYFEIKHVRLIDLDEAVILTNNNATVAPVLSGSATTDWEAAISVHPNPLKDHLYIHFSNGILKSAQLFSPQGQQLIDWTERDLTNGPLALSHIKSGVYFLRIETDKGLVQQKIVIP
ncbi:MAG TPA: T9SS type A sorting domain-containing protein [Saprospiraceae bacterium]|nr:T9SS type A sorting domain-containing protein [Saprospiraceae bacterium]HMQ84794.1 T9SS type A sorting domain-containing protein [Saprospiraceae bacterium]